MHQQFSYKLSKLVELVSPLLMTKVMSHIVIWVSIRDTTEQALANCLYNSISCHGSSLVEFA